MRRCCDSAFGVFRPKESIDDDVFWPEVLEKQLRNVRLPNTEPETFEATMTQLQWLKLDEADSERLDVVYDHFGINVVADPANVIVRCQVGASP